MKLNKHIFLFLLLLVTASIFTDLFSQNIPAKPTRQSSFEAFSKGNYKLAYSEFSELLLIYSKDPLYKYYAGVCLVKLSQDPGKSESFLQQALQSASVVKTLPSDALFYLGRAQQMSGKFTEALGSYNLYIEQVGKKAAREQGTSEFIQQCYEKKGQLKEPEIEPGEIAENEKTEINQIKIKPEPEVAIPQLIEKEYSAKRNLPPGYERILHEAIEFQFKSDSLYDLVSEQKNELEKLPASGKSALKSKISENELLAASFQRSADQKYSESQIVINPDQEKILPEEIVRTADKKITKDSLQQSDNKVIKATIKQPENIIMVVPEVKKPVETFAFFEVLAKPVTDPNIEIAIDSEVPEGLVYRIQIAVFRNPVAPSYFKGITPVYGFKVPGTDKTNYYAGMFRRSSDANKALTSVKAKGFKDSFVIALKDKKPVSADRAAILEKEWGKKPFVSIVKSLPETPIDTIPPTLTFRVEVSRSLKPLKADIVEGVKKMAGSRGLDIQSFDDGNIAYLIGKFITFESASEYADLLVRNGYREARVVAWLGKKEIPVEVAKQLFDNLE